MSTFQLSLKSLRQYWRVNVAVVLGVATAVTVLAGALLVGDSVRGSLRDLVLQRLGRTDHVVFSTNLFRTQLADDLGRDEAFGREFAAVAPFTALTGLAIEQQSGRRVLGVQIYGVDERFWRFMGAPDVKMAGRRDVMLSPALRRDLGADTGATILLRIQQPSDIPLDSLHGRKEEVGRTLRSTLVGEVPPDQAGEFSLQPQQGDVRAAFVPLQRLQEELELKDRVNALLVALKPDAAGNRHLDDLRALVARHAQPDDVGLSIRELETQHSLSVEGDGSLVDEPRAKAVDTTARALGLEPTPVFTYLANTIRSGDKSVPYSLVTAIDLSRIVPATAASDASAPGAAPIVLNEWTARELNARPGDPVGLDYYIWQDPGVLVERRAEFRVAAVVPFTGAAADRNLAPAYPGITDSDHLRDWDPPFPIDLKRIRPVDEEYWNSHRTTPKAFIPLDVGQSLWQSRYGALTSIRFNVPDSADLRETATALRNRLTTELDPFSAGMAARDVRAEGLDASRGATDFGEYFTYFSFFLVVSALLLAVLFFKLGVEQRSREVGLLRAVGYTPSTVRRLFVTEALLLSAIGSAIGIVGALLYAQVLMIGLRTWWVDAVGTTALRLHINPVSLLAGAIASIVASVIAIWWALRVLGRVSERSLLAGSLTAVTAHGVGASRWRGYAALALFASGLMLAAGASTGFVPPTGGFFGAGAALLGACLFAVAFALRRTPGTAITGHGASALARLGFRHSRYRPGRSVLAVAVIAFATFVLISVGAFRRDDAGGTHDRKSGTGGYALLINSMLPVIHDPSSAEGREILGLENRNDVTITPFRLRPGDDASCLNLYQPKQPRILGASEGFIREGRFAFQRSLAKSAEEQANPWLLLERQLEDGVIPVIADANSMTYVLHRAVGDELTVPHGGGSVRLRLVAALADSLFQGELLMSDANFVRLFPEFAGYQFMLVDAPDGSRDEISARLEDRLSDFGADAVAAPARLNEFHRVENTYLSTFQALGGLGLLLGTIGLAAVLLRNILERRRELALLGAVGFDRPAILTIVMAENALLLLTGLAAGTASALIAIAPAALERGGRIPITTGQWLLLFAVLVVGLISSWLATRAAVQTRLLSALRAE